MLTDIYLDQLFLHLQARVKPVDLTKLKDKDRFIEAVKHLMDDRHITEWSFNSDYTMLTREVAYIQQYPNTNFYLRVK